MLIETFVETPRYTGAVYRASGWIRVGATQGRGRYNMKQPLRQAQEGHLAAAPPQGLEAHPQPVEAARYRLGRTVTGRVSVRASRYGRGSGPNRTLPLSTASAGRCSLRREGAPDRIGSLFDGLARLPQRRIPGCPNAYRVAGSPGRGGRWVGSAGRRVGPRTAIADRQLGGRRVNPCSW